MGHVRFVTPTKEVMKRVEVNDPASIFILGGHYNQGVAIQQDRTKAIKLYSRSANFGYSAAHNNLAGIYHEGGDMKIPSSTLRQQLWQDTK